MKDFNLFVRFLKFLQRRQTAALPEGRVCHFAHLRNRSTIGNAFLTTQLTGSCILGLPRNDTFFSGMTKCDPSSMKDFIYFSGL
jgi:hypothetical protein